MKELQFPAVISVHDLEIYRFDIIDLSNKHLICASIYGTEQVQLDRLDGLDSVTQDTTCFAFLNLEMT